MCSAVKVCTIERTASEVYDGPNGSRFISILLHNSEFRIPKFALRISEFVIRNCEVYIIWASGNSQSTLEGI